MVKMSQEGLSIIEKFGAIPFNHREEGYQEKIIEATEGKGVDIILEMLSNVNLGIDLDLKLITKYINYVQQKMILQNCQGIEGESLLLDVEEKLK